MSSKYEFTSEILKWNGHCLHRIRRLSDGKLGGWIECEFNLNHEDNCWVDGEAKVYGDAHIYGDAIVYGNALIYGKAQVCDDAKVFGNARINGFDSCCISGRAKVYGNAEVYEYAQIYDNAKVYGNAKIYDSAKIYDYAKVHGDAEIYSAEVCGYMEIDSGEYDDGTYYCGEDLSNNNETKKVVQDFIYKVDDSNKLTTQTEYDSIDEFFDEPTKNDIKLDTLIICTVDTKEPLIKLQKVQTEDKTEFKFIVDITNDDGDSFTFKSIIKSQDQLNQLIQQTIEALRNYPKFNKYADELEECL